MKKLNQQYYLNNNVVDFSRNLIGKVLCTRIDNKFTSGIITETEAYVGITDKASHSFGGRRTKRTEVMYSEGGISYVYLCYGIHYLFNIVTNANNIPDACLIRAIKPLDGIEIMSERLDKLKLKEKDLDGPGKLSKALGITLKQNKTSLTSNTIWLEDRGEFFNKNEIRIGPRIGIDYAGEDAILPYRFKV